MAALQAQLQAQRGLDLAMLRTGVGELTTHFSPILVVCGMFAGGTGF